MIVIFNQKIHWHGTILGSHQIFVAPTTGFSTHVVVRPALASFPGQRKGREKGLVSTVQHVIPKYGIVLSVNFSPASGFDKASRCGYLYKLTTHQWVSPPEHWSYLSRADLMQGPVGRTLIALLPHLMFRLVSPGSWNSSWEVTSLDRR